MPFYNKRIAYPLILPAALIILSTILVWKWPVLTRVVEGGKELSAFLLILPLLPYALFAVIIVLGWRFGNSGIILTSIALGIIYFAISNTTVAERNLPPSWYSLSRVLLPLNLALFASLTKRRIFTPVGLLFFLLIFFQAFVLLFSSNPRSLPSSQVFLTMQGAFPLLSKSLTGLSTKLYAALKAHSLLGMNLFSFLITSAFAVSFIFLLLGYKQQQDPTSAGFLGSLVASSIGTVGNHAEPAAMVFFSAAGLILIITTIDSSFSMAYMDDLTGLPGRRSLNQTLINLGKKYSIAMIDVDHFKKFNDTYGHKTGDQVLKMIASKLKALSGGAKVFRYGGEEFTAVFPGRTMEEALPHLEVYRQIIETTPFIVRGKERRKEGAKFRARGHTGGQKSVKVTVSMGVAAPEKALTNPEQVLKAADKALYKAKKAGRNRVAT